jgi:hypothetical protein
LSFSTLLDGFPSLWFVNKLLFTRGLPDLELDTDAQRLTVQYFKEQPKQELFLPPTRTPMQGTLVVFLETISQTYNTVNTFTSSNNFEAYH